jgi:putative exosortase-associated protein (TIGR04073 family)
MRRCRLLPLLLLSGLFTAAPVHAQDAPRKFLRGLAGMTTAFLEVPGNMVAMTRSRGPAEGIPLGFAVGLGMIVPRVLVGVWEFVSAPFPLPAGYRPILKPEFPWSYFEGGGGEAPPRRRAPQSG